MAAVQNFQSKPVELHRVSCLVSYSVKNRLDALCRYQRSRHGWDYGVTLAKVLSEGLDSFAPVCFK